MMLLASPGSSTPSQNLWVDLSVFQPQLLFPRSTVNQVINLEGHSLNLYFKLFNLQLKAVTCVVALEWYFSVANNSGCFKMFLLCRVNLWSATTCCWMWCTPFTSSTALCQRYTLRIAIFNMDLGIECEFIYANALLSRIFKTLKRSQCVFSQGNVSFLCTFFFLLSWHRFLCIAFLCFVSLITLFFIYPLVDFWTQS